MSQYKALKLLCRLKRSRASLSDLHLDAWHSSWLLLPKLPIRFLACIKNLERLVSISFCLHGQKETVTAGEALVWPLIQCDNSRMVPVSIRPCKRRDWEEEHWCVLKHCQVLVLQTGRGKVQLPVKECAATQNARKVVWKDTSSHTLYSEERLCRFVWGSSACFQNWNPLLIRGQRRQLSECNHR